MAIAALTSRFATYYSRHGLRGTAQRAGTALKRALFFNRQVVFYCDLATQVSSEEPLPSSLKVERKSGFDELNLHEVHELIEFWNPKLARGRMEERFAKGASLWLIKSNERLAGYGWTLRGSSIAGYYFPMAESDVQFFDFHIFPKFRGRAIDWFLMTRILHTLATEGGGRAFAEAAEWNRASLSSLASTPFHPLGSVRHATVLGYDFVNWTSYEMANRPTPLESRR
jgi:hypothetical protein